MDLIFTMLVPLIIAVVALYGMLRRVDVYDALVQGAGDGLGVLIRIVPPLIGLLTAVYMLRASGALELAGEALSPVLARLGIPAETIALLLVRPVSGSAALGVGAELIQTYGPDSLIGRTAAVMLGSTETTFYTIAVYFGAAGIAIGKLLIQMGFGNVVMCDIHGIICEGDAGLNPGQEEISHISNRNHEHGTLADALKGADAFVGVSRPGLVTAEMVGTMNQGIVFPMANPVPEIMPDEAKRGGAAVVGTGRSDFPNQINNVLVFPGVFKGALMVRATDITEGMKIRAAHALADLIPADQLSPEYIIPSVLDKSVAEVVAKAVADEAKEQGIARIR